MYLSSVLQAAALGINLRQFCGDLNVASSFAAVFHGTLFAPGMWPPRSTPSCGYSGMCVISPLYSPGERTSISGLPALLCASASSKKARISSSRRFSGTG